MSNRIRPTTKCDLTVSASRNDVTALMDLIAWASSAGYGASSRQGKARLAAAAALAAQLMIRAHTAGS